MKLIRLLTLLLLVSVWVSNSEAQTSGGGPTTHSPNVSFCDLGSGACAYPYRVNVTTGSIYNPGNGTINLSTGGGSSGGGSPAGTGSELQYRASGTTFGAVSGSSVSGFNVFLQGNLDLNQNALNNIGNINMNAGGQLSTNGSTIDMGVGIIQNINDLDFWSGGVISDDTTGNMIVSSGGFSTAFNAEFGNSGALFNGIQVGSNGDVYGIRRNDGSDPLEIGYNDSPSGRGARFFGGSNNYGNLKLMNNEVQYVSLNTGTGTFTFSPVGGFLIDGTNGGATVQLTVSGSSGSGNYAIQAIGGQVGLKGSGTNGSTTATGYVGDGLNSSSPSAFTVGGGTYSLYSSGSQTLYHQGSVQIGTTTNSSTVDIKGNLSLGTYGGTKAASSNGLIVSGNVGIGTFTANNSLIVASGNLGIGTLRPGQQLDVVGTARMAGFNLSTSPTNNYVLTSDATGNGIWAAASGSSQFTTINTNDVYLPNRGNIGIGTTLTTTSALTVMNGNVGIGTWIPLGALTVMNGNVGIGSNSPIALLSLKTGTTAATGINFGDSTVPIFRSAAGVLTFPGSITMSQFGNMSVTGLSTSTTNVGSDIEVGNANQFGFSNSASGAGTEDAGLSRIAAGKVGVGNGTTQTYSSALVAGNIGIGTLNTAGGVLIVNSGNVGIGSLAPQAALTIGTGGHFKSTGTAPTVSNNDCGTTTQGTVASGSTDIKGSFTAGTLTVTSCAVTFNIAFGSAPICFTQDDTNILGTKTTTTTTKMTTTSTTSMSGDVITYVCIE